MPGTDAPWRKLYKRIEEMHSVRARVGVLSSKGGEKAHGNGDATVVEVAAFHEFGTEHVPERSFIRSTFYSRRAAQLKQKVAEITRAIVAGAIDVRKGVGLLGAWGAGEVKNTITQTDIAPPLAPATVEAKGSSQPLVDTGQLLGSITWEVVDE
jgi:hypothetical protein